MKFSSTCNILPIYVTNINIFLLFFSCRWAMSWSWHKYDGTSKGQSRRRMGHSSKNKVNFDPDTKIVGAIGSTHLNVSKWVHEIICVLQPESWRSFKPVILILQLSCKNKVNFDLDTKIVWATGSTQLNVLKWLHDRFMTFLNLSSWYCSCLQEQIELWLLTLDTQIVWAVGSTQYYSYMQWFYDMYLWYVTCFDDMSFWSAMSIVMALILSYLTTCSDDDY